MADPWANSSQVMSVALLLLFRGRVVAEVEAALVSRTMEGVAGDEEAWRRMSEFVER